MRNESRLAGVGFHFEDLIQGFRFHTVGRTVTETDITNFVSVTGMLEVLFTNLEYLRTESVIGARPAPAALVYCFAEGLLMQSTMQLTGMAFLEMSLQVHKPTLAGDTVHVECEVTAARETSRGDRGIVTTRNLVLNQRGENVLTYTPTRMIKKRST